MTESIELSPWLGRGVHLLALVASCGLGACDRRTALAEQAARVAEPPEVADGGKTMARVDVTERGFEPSRVLVSPSHPLVFRRTTRESCATALVFPEFGIEKALPLNTDVPVPLPDSAHGELAFQCGVGENRGKVVAHLAGG